MNFKRYIRNRIKKARQEKAIITKNALKDHTCDRCNFYRWHSWDKNKDGYCVNHLCKRTLPKEKTCRFFMHIPRHE